MTALDILTGVGGGLLAYVGYVALARVFRRWRERRRTYVVTSVDTTVIRIGDGGTTITTAASHGLQPGDRIRVTELPVRPK